MERLLFTLNAPARREKLAGREYLVAPVVMLVPGVLNGSKGPLYYPPDEVANNVDAWNGMPLTMYHPTDPYGNPASGRHPAIVESHGLGYVYNARIRRSDGALVGDGWFDLQEVLKKDTKLAQGVRLYPRLLSGKPIELSTGLFTENQPARPGAVFNGKPYAFVARKYRPDHLAILPDQQGACSLNDGCGVGTLPVNRIAHLLNQAVTNAKKGKPLASGGRWVTTDSGQRLFLHGGGLHTSPGGKRVGGKGDDKSSKEPDKATKDKYAALKDVQAHHKKNMGDQTTDKLDKATTEKLADHAQATAAAHRRKAMRAKDPEDKKNLLKSAATFEAVAAKHRKAAAEKK